MKSVIQSNRTKQVQERKTQSHIHYSFSTILKLPQSKSEASGLTLDRKSLFSDLINDKFHKSNKVVGLL